VKSLPWISPTKSLLFELIFEEISVGAIKKYFFGKTEMVIYLKRLAS